MFNSIVYCQMFVYVPTIMDFGNRFVFRLGLNVCYTIDWTYVCGMLCVLTFIGWWSCAFVSLLVVSCFGVCFGFWWLFVLFCVVLIVCGLLC